MKKKYEILEGYEEYHNKTHTAGKSNNMQDFYSKLLTKN